MHVAAADVRIALHPQQKRDAKRRICCRDLKAEQWPDGSEHVELVADESVDRSGRLSA